MDDNCTAGEEGRRGSHVGFPFNVGSTHCIVWVTTEEAFLECLRNRHRTSTTSGNGDFAVRYGQWIIQNCTTLLGGDDCDRSQTLPTRTSVVIGSVTAVAALVAIVIAALLIPISIRVKKRRRRLEAPQLLRAPPARPPLPPLPM